MQFQNILNNREDVDLMAPAGSFESLMAAIQGGADSVYFGIGNLNMRARSSFNFSEKDLDRIVRICRHFGKKAYMTLNVVFFDHEADLMRRTIDLAREKNVDAVIVSDPSAIQYARKTGMTVHASTQLNISNTESLRFYSDFADVVVLARELSLDQIAGIARQVSMQKITGPSGNLMKIEVFVHGALCMSVSGKCYLSLHHHNHSANRGECLQDCRRSYVVREKETGIELEVDNEHIMSPKDLCTIGFLDKILHAGASVLKIEGRARSPEYVKTVVSCYDEAIKSCFDGTFSPERTAAWMERLANVFNRDFWGGYYLGKTLGEWTDAYGSKAGKKKTYAAKNMNYFSKLGIADFLCESGSLRVGDNVLIMGPTTGVIEHVIEEIRVEDKSINLVKKGERFSIPVPRKVRRADKLYKLTDR